MSRFLVALRPSTTPSETIDILTTLRAADARVLEAWGPFTLIADGPDSALTAVRANPGVAQAVGTDGFISVFPDIDVLASALIAALNFGLTPAFLSPPPPVSPLPFSLPPVGCGVGLPVLGPGTTPVGVVGHVSDAALALAPAVLHTARRALVGTIGVAIVLIDGPLGSAARLTLEDNFWIMKGLTDGFDVLHKAAPAQAHLVFTPAIHRVEIDLDPATVPAPVDPHKPTAAEYETIEKTWRDKALAKLGAGSGRAGFRAVVNNSKYLFKVDWAFVIVITKYNAAWPAYAPDFRDVIVSYEMVKNRIGLAKLPSVIAHEIGHTVGALDEYAESGCSVLQKGGFSNLLNLNCAVGNPLSVPCLMKDGSLVAICDVTKSQFGWGDQNLDGVLDPFDPTFVLL